MIAPFEAWHVDGVFCENVEQRAFYDAQKPSLEFLKKYDLASTIMTEHGVVLAVLGAVIPEGAGECEVFIFPSSTEMRRHVVTFWRDLRQEIGRIQKRFAKIRALSSTEASAQFLQRLGFTLEGVCKRPGAEGRLTWVMEGAR